MGMRIDIGIGKLAANFIFKMFVFRARWYFDTTRKMCTPFYYAGCNGNENQFESQEDCEATCPNLYHPTIQLLAKVDSRHLQAIKGLWPC